MGKTLFSNQYTYIVDTDYGINKDGFIAIGTESIVYKGLKIKPGSDLRFSCVLKFKPKLVVENGERVDRLKIFKEQEWKIFEKLRECRSIVKIDDVIEQLDDFSLTCNYGEEPIVINNSSFFCVVEEFIDGWNLKQYCEEEFWKLRKIKKTLNGVSHYVSYPDYTDEEKKTVQLSYRYDNILVYQNQMIQFMLNLCEILQYVSGQELVLHLDIKPDNIMVTRYGKELVLIDFGRSRSLQADETVRSELPAVDYRNESEDLYAQFQHGTQGYAAPECYCEPAAGSEFPFHGEFEKGVMSVESDIFSFGATFWECLNVFELVTKTQSFANNPRDFYMKRFMDDNVYFGRDLSATSPRYLDKLEKIIKKCTRRRTADYRDPENKSFYHNYSDLKKDLEDARNSAPTIVREESTRVRRAFKLGGALTGVMIIFIIIFALYHASAERVAREKWESIRTEYNDTQFYRMESVAHELMDASSAAGRSAVYDEIASFTYHDGGDVSEYEAAMLVELMQMNGVGKRAERIDELVKNANARKLKEISMEIVKLDELPDCVGSKLARAIHDVEVDKTSKDAPAKRLAAYETLMELQDERDFHNAVLKLKNALNNDAYIREIAEAKNCDWNEIKTSLLSIT